MVLCVMIAGSVCKVQNQWYLLLNSVLLCYSKGFQKHSYPPVCGNETGISLEKLNYS